MATQIPSPLLVMPDDSRASELGDPARAIAGPWQDALFFWGAPAIALWAVWLVFAGIVQLSAEWAETAAAGFVAGIAVLTYAHLIAVVPRAYLNRQVFAAHRRRLTVVPVLLLACLVASPVARAIGGVAAILWDVHHSAMQNFGLARIYDLKAGNDPSALRRADLRLHWALYVGPIAAGASFMVHAHSFDRLGQVGLGTLAALPGVLQGKLGLIELTALGLWLAVIGWTALDYRRAMKCGYRLPTHKAVLTCITGTVSIAAWGFAPPLIAFAVVNIYHAVQYFALVWLKEGPRMTTLLGAGRDNPSIRIAALTFGGGCVIVGIAYELATKASLGVVMAPFIACSLLHFWYDSFIWSVRRNQI